MSGNPSAGSTLNVPVDVRRFPWIARLAADYAYDFHAVAPFFSGDPSKRSAWTDAVHRTQAHPRRPSEIAAIVAAQQQRRQAPPRAVEAASRLEDARAVAVLTGQQAGLFGGPLFTLFKALTAIKLAEQVARDHDVPSVPVFWVDAEDHDWNEVRSCTVFDAELTPRTVSLPERGGTEASPVATITLDDAVLAALGDLESILPATEFRDSLLAQLREHYAPGRGMADAFARWLEQVLGPRGLVVYDSSDPAAKPLVADLFARELATARTVELARSAGLELASRGYHSQVRMQEGSLAIFQIDRGGRRPIRAQDGQSIVGDEHFSTATLVAKATTDPASFSPNVLLRPLVQDTIFPTVCYVAGPSELAYLGQLRGVYNHFGVPMPLVYPRASGTLVDSAAFRFLSKFQLPLEALQAQDEAALNRLLASLMPPRVDESFAEAAHAIGTHMARVIETVPAVDPTLEGAAKSTLSRMQHELQTLRAKMIHAAKRRDETLQRQFIRTRSLAFPSGHPQERAIGFVSFLNQYGPALLQRLEDQLPLDLGWHWIVHI